MLILDRVVILATKILSYHMKKYHHRIQMTIELKSGWTDERTDWILLRMLILLEPCAVLIPTCIQKGFSSSDFFWQVATKNNL